MRPDHEREEAEHEQRIDHQPVAPERLARVVGDDFRDDAHRRQHQHVDLGVAEEPEQVLPQQRVAAAGDLSALAADDQPARQEEAGAGEAIHALQDRRGLQRRKGEQQQERGDELRPDEERQAEPGHAGARSCTIVVMKFIAPSSDEKIRQQHADQPERLAVAGREIGRAARTTSSRCSPRRPGRRSWRA